MEKLLYQNIETNQVFEKIATVPHYETKEVLVVLKDNQGKTFTVNRDNFIDSTKAPLYRFLGRF